MRPARFVIAFFIVLLYSGGASALTADEVIRLKKAGVSDETIRLMIEQEQAGRPNPSDRIGTREVRDDAGNPSVIHSTGAPAAGGQNLSEQEKVDRAWKMLQNQNVLIDKRR